jgi:hypothetical protein
LTKWLLYKQPFVIFEELSLLLSRHLGPLNRIDTILVFYQCDYHLAWIHPVQEPLKILEFAVIFDFSYYQR